MQAFGHSEIPGRATKRSHFRNPGKDSRPERDIRRFNLLRTRETHCRGYCRNQPFLIGTSRTVLTIHGQALANALALDERLINDELGSHWWPNRGLGGGIPSDPGLPHGTSRNRLAPDAITLVIYRLYEGVIVYGHPIKAVIHEKFGDGIMSVLFSTG